MRVEVLGCSGGMSRGHDSTCLRLGDRVLLDAGTGASKLSAEEMLLIKDIVISHSHLDHVAGVCFITDQDVEHRKESTRLHSLPATNRSFRRFIVNEVLWPEIQKVVINGVHMVEFKDLVPFEKVSIQGLEITPFPVLHAVPTLGFCFHGKEHDMVFASDMISMERESWDFVASLDRLKYFITEAAFPNNMEEIARISKHLTPEMLHEICKKVKQKNVEFYATHIKPLYHEAVSKEIEVLKDPEIKILEDGMVFEF